MTGSSHELFIRLRERYLTRSAERLESIEAALDRLEVDPTEREALSSLVRAFHGFAGAGTYGFEQITLMGKEGEALSHQVSGGDQPIRADQYRRLRELAALIGEQLEEGSEQTTETDLITLTGPEKQTIRKERGPERRNVLLVGERAGNHRVLDALQGSGMDVSTASTADEASTFLRRKSPDVLITDVDLPDSSGYQLVRIVREHPGGDRKAAFVINSHGGFLDKVEAIRCGADGSFQEPVDEGAVMRRIHMVLDRPPSESSVILLVEDEPDQAAYIQVVLESAGYQVFVCSDPTEFERALSQHTPDLLLMDVLLPKVSGYELARYVRQDEAHAALPILFLTTESQAEAAVESIRSGADDLLLKPVSPTMLLISVAARIERARMLRHLLDRDGLTGLLTHTAFIERLTVAHKERTRGNERPIALVMLDIDHFKHVNDRFGHPAGDKVLASLAAYLRRRLRQTDTIGRYGGEEFGILLKDLEAVEAKRLFEHMLEEFAAIEHPVSAGQSIHIEFSVGIALLDIDRMPEVNPWIEAADAALYQAKDKGRRRVEIAA